MNKTLTTMLVLGTSAALLVPTAGSAWARHGDDDSSQSSDDSGGRDRARSSDDSSTPGDDDGTPDQGSGDNGVDDSPSSGDDDGTPDQGRGGDDRDDSRRDDSRRGDDDSRGRDRDRSDKNRVEVRRSGQCSASSQWRIRIRVREDRTRIRFQVDGNVVGQLWTYSVSDNGTEVLSGSKRTHAPSGDFTAQRKWRGIEASSHQVTATATNPQTGETCEGAASV